MPGIGYIMVFLVTFHATSPKGQLPDEDREIQSQRHSCFQYFLQYVQHMHVPNLLVFEGGYSNFLCRLKCFQEGDKTKHIDELNLILAFQVVHNL